MPICETFLSALSLLCLPRLCRFEDPRWRGCVCSISEHPEIILLQPLRAQPAVQFWKSVIFILPAKGKIVRPCSFQNRGLGVPGDEAEESSFVEMWNGCVFFRVAYCFNGQIKWRLLCYVASHSGIMYLSPVSVFYEWRCKTFSSPSWGKCSFFWFKVCFENNGTFPNIFD